MSNLLKQAEQFFALKRDWLGDNGTPVPRWQAQFRANVCLKCPKNVERPLEEYFKGLAVRDVKRTIEVKNKMNLSVDGEKGLHICDACGCVLRLKIFVPLKHILANDDSVALPDWCWVELERKEIK